MVPCVFYISTQSIKIVWFLNLRGDGSGEGIAGDHEEGIGVVFCKRGMGAIGSQSSDEFESLDVLRDE